MTVFAPHTTGIPLGVDKELEIIKQLHDVSVLVDAHDNYDDVYASYIATLTTELAYRGLSNSPDEVLQDTIEASACIASRGKYHSDDYRQYIIGIRGIANHIYRGAVQCGEGNTSRLQDHVLGCVHVEKRKVQQGH